MSAFTTNFFEKLGAKRGHPFFRRPFLAKKVCSPKLWGCKKKNLICQIFHQKKIQKVLMKIEEMADVFLNSSNFAKHTFLTLAPPSSYSLNLKALIKLSKVSWTSQLSYEILRSSFKRKFDKTNFISPKRTPPKSTHHLGLSFVGYVVYERLKTMASISQEVRWSSKLNFNP